MALFRGAAGLLTTEKSKALRFVSVQLAVLLADLVALRTAVADVSEQLADPYPAKSTTVAERGQPPPLRTLVPVTNATFPSVALMLIDVLLASAGGSAAPMVGVAGASLIRKYWPGAIVPEVRFIVLPAENVPEAEAYWTE